MPGRSRLIAPSDLPEVGFVIPALPLREEQQLSDTELPLAIKRQPNLSLVFQRYFPAHDKLKENQYRQPTPSGLDFSGDWQAACTVQGQDAEDTRKKQNKAKRNVRETATEWPGSGALGWFEKLASQGAFPQEFLNALVQRRRKNLEALGTTTFHTFCPTWRLAAGLANPSPKENSGWQFHHTYGFPVIPGPSLKGLVRHFLEEELAGPFTARIKIASTPGQALLARAIGHDPETDEDLAQAATQCTSQNVAALLFGDPSSDGHEGAVCFHDGWPRNLPKDGWFEVDVLTVHHPNYYARKQGPTDDEGPVPAHFLTVRNGTSFEVPVTLTALGRALPPNQGEEALKIAGGLLVAAAQAWGVGGKTGAGYGRLQLQKG